MKQEQSTERLDYQSGQRSEEEWHYTPRPLKHFILAWVLIAVVLFAIGGMLYWEIFGRF